MTAVPPPPQQPSPAGPDLLPWILGFVGGGAVITAGLVVLLIWLATPAPPPVYGPVGESTTSESECGEPCFTAADAALLGANESDLSILGQLTSAETPLPTLTSGEWEDAGRADFVTSGGTPQSCVFAQISAPVAPSSTSWMTRDDQVIDLGSLHGDASVSQLVRVFDSGLWAGRYPNSIRAVLNPCTSYTIDDAGVAVTWQVEPAEFEVASDEVAIVSWTETSAASTTTTIDLQYGTLVWRTEIARTAASPVTEAQIAEYVMQASHRMLELAP